MLDPKPSAVETNGELRNRVKAIRFDGQPGMTKESRGGAPWLPWVLCLLLAGSWALVGVRWYRATPAAGEAAVSATSDSGSSTSSGSKSSASAAEPGTVQVAVTGYLIPPRQIAVSPIDVSGRIIDINIIEGKIYKEGDFLAQIDPASFQAAYDEVTASVLAAKRRYEAAVAREKELLPASVRKVELDQLEAQINEAVAQGAQSADQLKRLMAIAGASGRELTQAQNDVNASEARVAKLRVDLAILKEGPRQEKKDAAKADVDAAYADMQAAQARLVQAKWRLDNCTIKAPITGTVLNKKCEKGNLVNPLAFAATSGSVADMADLSDLEVDLDVAEKDIGKLQVGQPCRVLPKAFPDKRYEGKLDRIMPTATRANSTVKVRVKVMLPPGEIAGTFLKPEMGADVTFLPMK